MSISATLRHPVSRSLVVFALLLLPIHGCKKIDPTEQAGNPERPAGGSSDATPEAQTAAKTEIKLAPPTMKELDPVIREVGETGTIPSAITVDLALPVLRSGRVLDAKMLQIVPPIKGELRRTSDSTMTFVPACRQCLEPDTRYQVTLQSIPTQDGDITPALGQARSRVFTTPRFELSQLKYKDIDLKQKQVSITLVFSGPVDAMAVQQHASWLVNGKPARSAWYTPGLTSGGNTVDAIITADQMTSTPVLEYSQTAGIAMSGRSDLEMGEAKKTFTVPGGDVVLITGIQAAEGVNGFYVDVNCRDLPPVPGATSSDAAAGTSADSSGSGESEGSDDGSQVHSCMVDEAEAARAIHLTPAIKFNLSRTNEGFRLYGDFARGPYAMHIDPGLHSQNGGVVKRAYDGTFAITARKAQVGFVAQGRYLPRDAWKSLAIRYMNTRQALLRVRHITPENMVFWMSSDDNESADERNSDIILEQKIPLEVKPDLASIHWLDVSAVLPQTPRGVLELSLLANNNEAKARLLLTDINLVAKRDSGGQVMVWALDMRTNRALSGVEVRQVVKSGRTQARCTTDLEGGCTLPGLTGNEVDPAEPFALIATHGTDLTYLRYSDLKTSISEERVQGDPYDDVAAYRASLYSDRGAYRPGDVAHVTAILRDKNNLAPAAGMPVQFKLIDPKQQVARKVLLKTGPTGMVTTDFAFAAFADTGRYETKLEVGGREVGGYGFNVEEFVPERMKVTVSSAKPSYLVTDSVPIRVAAQYLFGGSAAGSTFSVACSLRPGAFSPKKNANYDFGVWIEDDKHPQALQMGSVEGEIGEDSSGTVSCPAPRQAGGFAGAAELVAEASVLEAGSGRATVNQTVVPIHPEQYYVGLLSRHDRVKVGEPFSVEGIVVDWEGNPISTVSTVDVELLRLETEYQWAYDEDAGEWNYHHARRPVSEGTLHVAVSGGKFKVDLTAHDAGGGYLVRAKAGRARTDLHLEGEAESDWWMPMESSRDTTPHPARPNWIDLKTPDQIKVGEKVEVSFTAAWRGRVLFTAETDEVLTHAWKEVTPGPVTWSFVMPKFAPNVYVGAFLVKDPAAESPDAFLPDRAFGVKSVRVEPTEYTRALKLDAPSEVRSNSPLTVKLDMGPLDEPTTVTVAAVDEGILSLTRFQTPDPFASIFTRRALGIETFETIGWTLLLPPKGPSSSTGGDAEGAAGRVQPVKPVALWSGMIEVPASGRASVTFNVPEYRGSLRVMAIGAGKKRMARAALNVLVRDPLVVQTTVPRFLTQGDEVQIPVFVTNLSGQPQSIDVQISAVPQPVPGLTLPAALKAPVPVAIDKSIKSLKLAVGASGTVVFRATAMQALGAAHLTVEARAGALLSREQHDVPFIPAQPRSRLVQRFELSEGSTDLAAKLQGWLPTTERTSVWVTNNPYADAFNHLGHLLHYPYGCIEQTTSSTRPLLYVSNLIQHIDPTLVADASIDDMVMAGIGRALSMQTPSGGFAYWPGGTEPVMWGTAYATHMLLDAQKLKYSTPHERVDLAIEFLERELTNRFEKIAPKTAAYQYLWDEEPYMQYVVALAGKGRKARMQRLIAEREKLVGGEIAEQLYLLKAGLYLAGDRRYEADLKHPDVSTLTDQRDNSWSFYSDRRRRGLVLSTFIELFGNNPAGQPLADLVAGALRGHVSDWYTTQELVWSITGLGKWVGTQGAKQFAPPTLLADGRELRPVGCKEKPIPPEGSDRSWALARASEYRQLELKVPSKDSGKLYLILNSEGIRDKATWEVGGNGMKLERRYLKADGSPLDLPGGGLTLGDLVYVEITLTDTSVDDIRNIALVDRFPAGWEVENPRLGRDHGVDWVNKDLLWGAEYMNIRDDRIEVFGSLSRKESRKIVYALRAVTAGRFALPPVEAEAMYDPRLWARGSGGTVVVNGPWAKYLN